MPSYKTTEEKEALIPDMHTVIWAYAIHTKGLEITVNQKPILGIIGHDSIIGNFFVPITKDNRWDRSKVVPIDMRDYTDTKVEAIREYNTAIEDIIANCKQHISALEAMKL